MGSTRKRLRSGVDNQRSEFLRLCRARIRPSEVGLTNAPRTRSGGLRREDVAAVSGVSASWYTWLEQGRDMRVSDEVLERICHTFRLTEDERVYLFSLVQHRPPRIDRASRFEAPALAGVRNTCIESARLAALVAAHSIHVRHPPRLPQNLWDLSRPTGPYYYYYYVWRKHLSPATGKSVARNNGLALLCGS